MIFNTKKYHYNPVTLAFEEIKTDRKHRIAHIISIIFIILTITIASGYWLNNLFGSQEARILENQKADLIIQMQTLSNKAKHLGSELHNDLFIKDNNYRAILQMDTVSYAQRLAGIGGSAADNRYSANNDLSYQIDKMIERLDVQLKIQMVSFETLYERAQENSTLYTHIPAIQPVAQSDLIMISSDFGIRSDPFFLIEQVHSGLDFVAPRGKNVYATGDGIVTFAQYSRTGYGNEIVIDHKFGFGSRYAHLDTIFVKEGETVRRGQAIGTVGATGRATGPHLHYEVLYEKRQVNPSYYFDTSLTTNEYAQIISIANEKTN